MTGNNQNLNERNDGEDDGYECISCKKVFPYPNTLHIHYIKAHLGINLENKKVTFIKSQYLNDEGHNKELTSFLC